MDPNVVALMEAGLAMGAVDFKRLEFVRTEHWQRLAAIFERVDALLCPTMALPPQPHGMSDGDYGHDDGRYQGRYHGLDMTSPFNFVAQCPALSVPSGVTAAGLPTGLQIVGRRFDDPGVLRIGAALERCRPWAERRPPL
jgi:Asp-tRNA(Asn)/Glu-tRNA(Gln) amidotransferase A subunit family amidase